MTRTVIRRFSSSRIDAKTLTALLVVSRHWRIKSAWSPVGVLGARAMALSIKERLSEMRGLNSARLFCWVGLSAVSSLRVTTRALRSAFAFSYCSRYARSPVAIKERLADSALRRVSPHSSDGSFDPVGVTTNPHWSRNQVSRAVESPRRINTAMPDTKIVHEAGALTMKSSPEIPRSLKQNGV